MNSLNLARVSGVSLLVRNVTASHVIVVRIVTATNLKEVYSNSRKYIAE